MEAVRIDYVELAVADTARSKAFYGRAFGWTFTDFGPGYTEFADGRMKGGFNALEGGPGRAARWWCFTPTTSRRSGSASRRPAAGS